MPLVSILIFGMLRASSAANSGSPGTRVGSPPVTTRPSSQRAWDVTNRSTETGVKAGTVCGRQARSAL